jgi:hypothetical protein
MPELDIDTSSLYLLSINIPYNIRSHPLPSTSQHLHPTVQPSSSNKILHTKHQTHPPTIIIPLPIIVPINTNPSVNKSVHPLGSVSVCASHEFVTESVCG